VAAVLFAVTAALAAWRIPRVRPATAGAADAR